MKFFFKSLSFVMTINVIIAITEDNRELNFEAAPGCREVLSDKCDFNLFYVKAVGTNDTLHYLWDFTTKPSLLLASTKKNVSLHVDWHKFLKNESNSISFSSNPYYGFLILIDEFVEFEDPNDTGYFTVGAKNISFRSESFTWKYSKQLKAEKDGDSVSCELIGVNGSNGNISLSGSVIIQLNAFGSSNHDKLLPRLLHSSNSTQVKIILQDLTSNISLINSRWAVKFSLISTSSKTEKFEVETKKSLDDENSPGVFSVVNIVTPKTVNNTATSGFLQWRPVVYTSSSPSISNSSDVDIMDLVIVNNPKSGLNGTLATKIFNDELNNMLIENTMVTFGSAQDGFYHKTNFSSWAFLISYGEPQEETFSKLVILVMAIGLGLPALLVILGGFFMCTRRFYKRSDELSFEH